MRDNKKVEGRRGGIESAIGSSNGKEKEERRKKGITEWILF